MMRETHPNVSRPFSHLRSRDKLKRKYLTFHKVYEHQNRQDGDLYDGDLPIMSHDPLTTWSLRSRDKYINKPLLFCKAYGHQKSQDDDL